jgi:hypothetical protein
MQTALPSIALSVDPNRPGEKQLPDRISAYSSRTKGSRLDSNSTIASGSSRRRDDPRIRSTIFSSMLDTSQ